MESSTRYKVLVQPADHELKRKSIRGGIVSLCAQFAKFVLQTGTLMVLARLLSAEDFGLQGMATVLIGFLGLFGDAGLASATVQRADISEEQISTLFWINAAVGGALAASTIILAPALATFYNEPRLYWITIVLGIAFLFSGLAAQHRALIVREMRFATLAKIDVLALAISSSVGIAAALLHWHYWALVAMWVANSIVSAAGAWLAVAWLPGPPRRKCGILSMLHFGWMATCNNFIVFLAWNADNILLGRVWGADALGLYGRAYQLATMPVNQLNGAITGVAFSGLSRIQNDAERLARSFVSGFSMLVSLTVPITISCALFAEEIVQVLLGHKWMEAAPIFRLLAPTGLVFALVNPLSWLVMSTGQVGRALRMSLATTPLVILGIIAGLSYGPKGVALGYSSAMLLLIVPITAWSKKGTCITWTDLWRAIRQPLLSGLVAVAIGLIVKITLGSVLAPSVYLLVGLSLVLGAYAWTLLFALGQKRIYLDLLNHALRGSR